VESEEASEIIRRCGQSPIGFSRKGFNNRLDEKTQEIDKNLSRFCRYATHPNIASDIWTSADYHSFLSVMFITMDDNMNQVRRLIGFEELNGSHNADNIQTTLRQVLESVDISPEQVIGFTMDQAQANIRALRDMRGTDSGTLVTDSMVMIPCLSHILQNSLKDGFQQSSYAEELTEGVHRLMKVLKNRLTVRDILRRQQRESTEVKQVLEPITYNATRWHSTSSMLCRFVQLFPFLRSTLDEGRNGGYISLSEYNSLKAFLAQKEDVVAFAQTLEQIRKQCKALEQEEAPTLGTVMRVYLLIVHEILPAERGDPLHSFKRTVCNSLTSRLSREDTDSLVSSSLLSPTFITSSSLLSHLLKTFGLGYGEDGTDDDFQEEQMKLFARFCESIRRYWKHQQWVNRAVPADFTGTPDDCSIDERLIHQELKRRSASSFLLKKRGREETSEFPSFAVCLVRSFLSYFDTAQALVQDRSQPQEAISSAFFWKHHGDRFPLLFHPAKLLMSVPPSIAAAEGSFSISGWLRGPRRTRLNGSRLKQMMLVRYEDRRRIDDGVAEEEEEED
jgi:hypothetical protein